MQYELYIDVFFLVNFMMDSIILLLVRKVVSCTATRGRTFLGAFFGALITCVLVCLPIPAVLKVVGFHLLGSTAMIGIGLRIHAMRPFLTAWIWLYLISFLAGGVLTWLYQYIGAYLRVGSLFYGLAAGNYYFLKWVLSFLEKFWKLKKMRRRVMLYLGEKSLQVTALIDSGNGLTDRISGKPVHILGRQAARRLLREERLPKVRYIPYQTIGEEAGVLPVITIDKMCIYEKEKEKKKEIISPLLGISEQSGFADGAYEMILQPDSC